jgi:hypothetical protein
VAAPPKADVVKKLVTDVARRLATAVARNQTDALKKATAVLVSLC